MIISCACIFVQLELNKGGSSRYGLGFPGLTSRQIARHIESLQVSKPVLLKVVLRCDEHQ